MPTFMDLMALARRVRKKGETETAQQIVALALSDDDNFNDEAPPQHSEKDEEALQDQNMLEAFEDGDIDPSCAEQHVGKVPVAMLLDLVTLAQRLKQQGLETDVLELNQIIECLSEAS